MRFNLLLAFGSVAALLLTSPANAQLVEPDSLSADTARYGHSPELSCKNAKLRAADAYTSCLIHVLSESKVQGHDRFKKSIAWCDAGFNRAFGLAEAQGDCHTPGGASTIREPDPPSRQVAFAQRTTGHSGVTLDPTEIQLSA